MTTVISVTALAGIPTLVTQAFGEKVLRQANRAAMLDIELIEDQNCFIPHATMTAFLDEIERRAGEPNIGLLAAPSLSLERYGPFGRYVLGADTLGEAIRRGIAAMKFHSRGDQAALTVRQGVARFEYRSAARGLGGYRHVACGAIGVMVNLCRTFLPHSWRPQRIEMDLPRPRSGTPFEDVFDCPVVFEARALAVLFDAGLLKRSGAPSQRTPFMTLEDLARSKFGPQRGDDLRGIVADHVWTQVLAGAVSIESTAKALDISIRSLQRALNSEGTDFRGLTNVIRARRAKELLAGTGASITEIAYELGYSSPAHFSRAFRNATGVVPREFRREL